MENITNQYLNNTSSNNEYYTPKQGRLPLFIADVLDICDPVFTFERIMKGCNLEKYVKSNHENTQGRIGYNLLKMLKVVLFGFMKEGYASLRTLEDKCKTNLRYMYIMDYEAPTYKTFGNFINNYLKDNIEEIFNEIKREIFEREKVDLNHIYIDGSKFEANANKYTWVWKKATEKNRFKLYEKITALLEEINKDLQPFNVEYKTNTEYEIPYTRIIEHKHFEFGTQDKTVISKEYSSAWKLGVEPYYPINDEKNMSLYKKYKEKTKEIPNVIFGGRLGQYQYMDMDDVIEAALRMLEEEA